MPITTLPVSRAELDKVNLKGCSLFLSTEPWPLYQRIWYFISLKTNILALLLIQLIAEIVHFHILPAPNLGGHRKFERLIIVWGHWTVTAAPKYVIFHILKKSNLLLFLIKKIPKISTYCGFHSLSKKKIHVYIACLTYWGQEMHICVGNQTTFGSDNGLATTWQQAIINVIVNLNLRNKFQWNLQRNLYIFKMHFKMCGKWRSSSLGPNVSISVTKVIQGGCHRT